ncbi:hypothetical protein Tco_1002554 [Tanacetum coccineum]|uniref:Transposase (Putative), gypsy type n=1 Tax=Tanacetum coccineum TaxID=301880 RepID=A0ABQ5F6P3_9ASTR
MPTGKIGVYTRFFEFANFRVPLSTFLVDVVRFFKGWNDHFFWVDAFACPASFSWHMGKSVSKDPFPQSTEFNAEHYASLVAYPAPFHKYTEPFLCLVGISCYYTLDENTYPEFLYENGRVVPLLSVAPARASSELEANVDKLFEEGGSVSETAVVFAENAAPLQPRRQRKRKTVVSDAGEPSHPPKKLREDHGISTGPSVAGKSRSALQRLLAGAMLNPEVGVVALPTLPFITSFVSVTPGREDGGQADFMVGANLRTITAPPRLVISSDSSSHLGANIVEAEVDSFARPSALLMTMTTTVTSTVDPTTTAKEKFVESSIFGGGSSSGAELSQLVFLTLLVMIFWLVTSAPSLILTLISEKSEVLKVKEEEVKDLKAQLLLKEAEAAEAAKAIRLCAEASKFETAEKSL